MYENVLVLQEFYTNSVIVDQSFVKKNIDFGSKWCKMYDKVLVLHICSECRSLFCEKSKGFGTKIVSSRVGRWRGNRQTDTHALMVWEEEEEGTRGGSEGRAN